MTKKDLKNGMMVKTRNDGVFIVLNNRLQCIDWFLDLDDYNENLLSKTDSEWDIVEVGTTDDCGLTFDFTSSQITIVWIRPDNSIKLGDIFENEDGDRIIICRIDSYHNEPMYDVLYVIPQTDFGINTYDFYSDTLTASTIKDYKFIRHSNYVDTLDVIFRGALNNESVQN